MRVNTHVLWKLQFSEGNVQMVRPAGHMDHCGVWIHRKIFIKMYENGLIHLFSEV